MHRIWALFVTVRYCVSIIKNAFVKKRIFSADVEKPVPVKIVCKKVDN